MNLAAYDKVNVLDTSRDYINVADKKLVSSTIEYHDFYCLLKRYNVDKDKYDFYVAVYDNKQQGAKNKFLKNLYFIGLSLYSFLYMRNVINNVNTDSWMNLLYLPYN